MLMISDSLVYFGNDFWFFCGDVASLCDVCVEIKEERWVMGCVVAITAPVVAVVFFAYGVPGF